jgi:hypothetical protein
MELSKAQSCIVAANGRPFLSNLGLYAPVFGPFTFHNHVTFETERVLNSNQLKALREFAIILVHEMNKILKNASSYAFAKIHDRTSASIPTIS